MGRKTHEPPAGASIILEALHHEVAGVQHTVTAAVEFVYNKFTCFFLPLRRARVEDRISELLLTAALVRPPLGCT
jgi:hypothetical protein